MSKSINIERNKVMANTNNIGFFNLKADGESAVVRLLHTTPDTIEHVMLHTITVEGKKRSIKCLGDNCPLCRTAPSERIYIHLIDFTDGQEKVWGRTATIIKQLVELYQSWGNLSNLVLKITRVGNEFPRYNIMVMPSQGLQPLPADMIDAKVAFRFYLYRSMEEIQQYMQTGILPPHTKKQPIPKEQYFAQQQSNGRHMNEAQSAYTPPTNAPYTPQANAYTGGYVAPTQTPYGNNGAFQPMVAPQSYVPQTPPVNNGNNGFSAPSISTPVYNADMYADPFAPPIRKS